MLSRSVSAYTSSPTTSTQVGFDPRSRQKPRASCPPVPLESHSPASVDERAQRLVDSAEQLTQALELWSLNKRAYWRVSALFARFLNDCDASIAVFEPSGADTTFLKRTPAELRPPLEELISGEASVSRFEKFKPTLERIMEPFLAEVLKVKDAHGVASLSKAASLPKVRSINSSIEGFVKSVGKLKEAVDVWSIKETPDDDIRTALQHLEDDFKALSVSFADRGMDLSDDISPVFEELQRLVNQLLSPDGSDEGDEGFDDQFKSILIRLLSGLKMKQTELSQSRQELKRRATFRLRSSVFEEAPTQRPRFPSTFSRSTGTLGRNFTVS